MDVSKISHGLTVSHETVALFQMKQWDCFLSGENNCFAFLFQLKILTFLDIFKYAQVCSKIDAC